MDPGAVIPISESARSAGLRKPGLAADIADWTEPLGVSPDDLSPIRKHAHGTPIGSGAFLQYVRSVTGRFVRPKKPGPRRKMSTLSPDLLSTLFTRTRVCHA